ncbi:MAG: redox-sensitive bicupin YhaK (pirin superfamily) [Saprospiraceae bacterium]|jgi:redox-sensitive bicupin YhaK (pirin superfamily)
MSTKKSIQIETLGFPWQTEDPFLFCAYHRDEYPQGNDHQGIDASDLKGRQIGQDFVIKDGYRMYHGKHVPGFPYHPHRGFETISICKEGFIDHSDSLGAAGRFGAGDVQWMTAGKGVQHSEMFPLVYKDKKNPMEMFQVWLNLPKRSKFVEPHFKMLWSEKIPIIIEKDAGGNATEIDLIAGTWNGQEALDPTPDSWAADPRNGVTVLTIKMNSNASLTIPKTSMGVGRSLYFYSGNSIKIDEMEVKVDHRIIIDSEQDITIKNGNEEACFLFLQGAPIKESVAQHGPFVMNTQEEIQEAFSDFRRTQFGGWPWPMQEQVHDSNKGRFALHVGAVEEEIPTS